MKLKYKIAKTTESSSEEIIKKILLLIAEKKYGILEVTSNHVSFNDHTSALVGNWEYYKRIKSGEFEVINNENNNIVVFEYYPIPVFEFFWAAILSVLPSVFGIIDKVYFIGLLGLPFLGQLIFKHFNLKEIANEMLTEVST